MKLATVAALIALVCPLAAAQNFPPIADMPPLSERGKELLQRIIDKRMIEERVFPLNNPRRELDAIIACERYVALVSLQLGHVPGFHDGYGLSGWVWNLPLIEEFMSESYGGTEKVPKNVAANFALIRERAKLHDLEINDTAYTRFSDVPKGHWADEAIHRLRELGIVKGYTDNTFRG
jgi:hypothetical protein